MTEDKARQIAAAVNAVVPDPTKVDQAKLTEVAHEHGVLPAFALFLALRIKGLDEGRLSKDQ
jgi:hypothetical protein